MFLCFAQNKDVTQPKGDLTASLQSLLVHVHATVTIHHKKLLFTFLSSFRDRVSATLYFLHSALEVSCVNTFK